MKRFTLPVILALLLCLIAAASIVLDLFEFARTPADPSAGRQVFSVRPGESFHSVAEHLHVAGLLSSPDKFRHYARLKGADKTIKAGEYVLSGAMTPGEILHDLASGKVQLSRITIPEGYNLEQIAGLVEAAGLGTASGFLASATDPIRAHRAGIEGDTFEGYLFPDTYFFTKGDPPEKIIDTMVSRFWEVFSSPWKDRARELGFTVQQIVTLASIIEKETGVASERPLISSVFHNRLKIGMRLESDPTVIYGIQGFDGNLTRKHLKTRTPYNTYRIRGLPPGPIASPGRASLEAALYPAKTTYLFFVSKQDTTHYFSSTIQEHNRAVRRYQLRR